VQKYIFRNHINTLKEERLVAEKVSIVITPLKTPKEIIHGLDEESKQVEKISLSA
jgi:hypothetical protein